MHHIAENGHHVVQAIHRINNLNVGEIAGFEPEVAADLIQKGHAKYVHRVKIKTAMPSRALNLKDDYDVKAGEVVAVAPELAERLVKVGDAAYLIETDKGGAKK